MQLQLPPIFSNNMVLQRRKHIRLWGKATHDSTVSVSIAGHSIDTITDNNGEWNLKLPPMEAGGPYDLTVSSENETITYTNVLIGEVWLAGGQSNMELELQNSDNGAEVVKNTNNDRIRFYYTPKLSYLGEELYAAEAESAWMECKPDETARWSAVGYYFAKQISKTLDVPVGIIGCNWGGTLANNWVSRDSLLAKSELAHFVHEYDELVAKQDFDEYLKELAEYKVYHAAWEQKVGEIYAKKPDATWEEVLEYAGENRWPGPMGPRHEFRPAGLYECMIKRIAPYTLGGAIYYQGESDEQHPQAYRLLLTNLIEEWRRLWKDDELPFGIVQLPAFAGAGEPTGYGWGTIRKAQQDVYRTIKNTSLTVITDCGEEWNIHPTDKETVGNRLAANVLKDIFGHTDYNGNGPRAVGYVITDYNGKAAIRIDFEGTEAGFYRNGEPLENGECELDGFEIAGIDNIYHPARVVVAKNSLILYNEQVNKPLKARYGSKNFYHPDIKDCNGYPVMPFWME